MKILLVEDDRKVLRFVRRGLAQLGILVDVAMDGRAAFDRALHGTYDVIVLDMILPFLDGRAVLQQLRKRGCRTPVLVLSANDGVKDRVQALNEGADDYVVKPFVFDELTARVRALARRPPTSETPFLRVGDLEIDLRTREVLRGETKISLTAKEFALIEYMASNEGTVLTRSMIAEQVWNQHFDTSSNVIDVYIKYLRSKIDDGFDQKLIHTVRGVGYVLSGGPA